MKLSEVIAPIKPIGPVTTVAARPSTGSTTANVAANIAPAGNTVSSAGTPTTSTGAAPSPSAGSTMPPPLPQQSIDALAQLIRSAGLTPAQVNQIATKAK